MHLCKRHVSAFWSLYISLKRHYWLAGLKEYGFCHEVYTYAGTDWLTYRHQIVLNFGLFNIHVQNMITSVEKQF